MVKQKTEKYLFLLWILVINLIFSGGNCSAISPCPLDERGFPVDWWVILKMPKISNSIHENGTSYFFATDKNPTPVYQLSAPGKAKSITDKNDNPLALTLKPMFDAMNNPQAYRVSYLIYNDQTNTTPQEIEPPQNAGEEMVPSGTTPPKFSQYGHLKGILVWNNKKGFWLVHSAPKFVFDGQTTYRYSYPSNAILFGQSFFCFSFNPNLKKGGLKDIAKQLLYCKPHIRQYRIDKSPKSRNSVWYNSIQKIINKQWIQDAPPFKRHIRWSDLKRGSRITMIKTLRGTKLYSFAKNAYWNNDLYAYLVEPFLRTSLFVETWRSTNSSTNFYSNCQPCAYNKQKMFVDIGIWDPTKKTYVSRYNYLNYPYPLHTTINVNDINIKTNLSNIAYRYTKDHSKWAISQTPHKPWVIIGDINRQGPHSQWIRGGGTVAIKNFFLWKFFKSIIVVPK